MMTQVQNPNEVDDDKDKIEVHESKGCLESLFCCFSSCFSWCCCNRKPVAKTNDNNSTPTSTQQVERKNQETTTGNGNKVNQPSVPENGRRVSTDNTNSTPTPNNNNNSSSSNQKDVQVQPNQQHRDSVSQNNNNNNNNGDVQQVQDVVQAENKPPILLPPFEASEKHKKTLVLDLDETLVHSSFKPIPNADFVISIELEGVIHRVYVLKRPGVDNFLRVVGAKFEVIVFTASLAKYADPLLDILDRGKVIKTRLFREACVHHYGNYVKDLSHLGRKLESTIIIDNSPFSYMFQPDNAIPISSWFNDKNDRQLYDLLPYLDSILQVDDVCTVLQRRKPPTMNATMN